VWYRPTCAHGARSDASGHPIAWRTPRRSVIKTTTRSDTAEKLPAMTFAIGPSDPREAVGQDAAPRKGESCEDHHLGEADGLRRWTGLAVVDKLDSGSAPAADAMNSRRRGCAPSTRTAARTYAVGAVWLDGVLVPNRAGTRKGRNVVPIRGVRSRCRFRVQTSWWRVTRARVTEPSAVAPVAKAWAPGWPANRTTAGRASPPRSRTGTSPPRGTLPHRAALGDRHIGTEPAA